MRAAQKKKLQKLFSVHDLHNDQQAHARIFESARESWTGNGILPADLLFRLIHKVVNLSRLFILLLREFSLISCSWCASAAFDVSIKSQKWKNGFLIAHFWWTSENKSPHQLTPSVNWRLLQLVWIWSTLWSIKPETVKARATNDFRTTWPRLGIASNVDWSHKFYNHLLVTTASDLDWLICLRR